MQLYQTQDYCQPEFRIFMNSQPEGWAADEDDPESEEDDDDDCAQVSDIFRSRVECLGDNPQAK